MAAWSRFPLGMRWSIAQKACYRFIHLPASFEANKSICSSNKRHLLPQNHHKQSLSQVPITISNPSIHRASVLRVPKDSHRDPALGDLRHLWHGVPLRTEDQEVSVVQQQGVSIQREDT